MIEITGIPLIEAPVPEPLASIVRLLRQTRWHPSKNEMNQATVESTLESIRWLLNHQRDVDAHNWNPSSRDGNYKQQGSEYDKTDNDQNWRETTKYSSRLKDR